MSRNKEGGSAMRLVIIGNSAAGVSAAEELRKTSPSARITIISDEKDIAYSRCLISRFLDGRLKAEGLYFKTRNFYHNLNIQPLLGKRAVVIDRKQQKISLEDGTRLDYDKLLLALGASPIRPKVGGLDLSGIFNFYSLEPWGPVLFGPRLAAWTFPEYLIFIPWKIPVG